MNLDFAKVCGKHSAIYEAYYKQIDPKGSGAIEAMTAAKFLKKSGLSDVVLSRIWDLSDPNGKGFLDKPGFFVALKLVSLAQAGQVINMSNIYNETTNPPKVGDLPKIMPPRIQTVPVSSGGVANGDWSISVIDRLKYEQLFESLKPVGGMLPGNKVKGVLMDSKLPMDTLGKIWDLADQDKDGNLDKHEFIVAMHLVYQTLEKRTVPDVLPVELCKPNSGGGVPPPKPAPPAIAAAMPRAPSGEGFGDGGFVANFPKDIAPPPAVPPLPAVPPMTRVPPIGSASVPAVAPLISTDPLISIGAPPSVTSNADWVVTPAEMKRFEVIFRDSDRDKDGLVSGLEVKNVFLQSGVPQNCLAHIWALCDTNQSGKLTLEQFALAMWMVERKQKGIEPPQVLTANMVPPSMRATVSGIDLQTQAEPKPTYSNPELEMISKEIEELAKERRALETEIAQKEADIRIKSGEVRSLQSELDTLSATLKQLENQRGEAQKRLDDLQAQSNEYQAVLAKLHLELSQMRNQVNKIRDQCQKQEETINEQEGELNAKRSELQKLKDDEAALQKEYDDNNRDLQKLTQHLQNTQLQISSVRSMVTQLMETQRQMTDALLMCRAAIESQDAELVTEYQLKIEPDLEDARKTLERKIDESKTDPFDDNRTKATSNGFATNGFSNDPFVGSGVGAATHTNTTAARSGFDDSFNAPSGFDSGFDAFGAGGGSAFAQQKDPFGGDAFANSASKINAVTPEPGKDDFGSDPFAALHAPTGQGQVLSPNAQKSGPPPRPESPSPALPPKKSKVPPPRPAPPRPVQGPPRPSQPAADAFGAAPSGSGFADFADFDNKLSTTSTSAAAPAPAHTLSTNSLSLFDVKTITAAPLHTLPMAGIKVPAPASAASASASASASSSSLSSINTVSNSTTNNHLTRSITPLQQAASAFMATTTAGNATNYSSSSSSSINRRTPVINGPTDFSDDPFKDYRYEDPFSIKDPFADEDATPDPDKIFNDDISLEGDEDMPKWRKNVNKETFVKADALPETFSAVKADTQPIHEFLDQFNAFKLEPSPVLSQKSTASPVITGGTNNNNNNNNTLTSNSSNKSQRNTPISAAGSAEGGLFDNVADFDAFSTNAAATTRLADSPYNPPTTRTDSNNANSIQIGNADAFYDAFTDCFNSNSIMGEKKPNTKVFNAFGEAKNIDPFLSSNTTGGHLSDANAFDAFATTTTTTTTAISTTAPNAKAAQLFDDFNDNAFEDDFFKTNSSSSTTSSAIATAATIAKDNAAVDNNRNNPYNDVASAGFAKFDAFDDNTDFAANFTTALNNSKNLTASSDAVDGEAWPAATKSTKLSTLTKVQNQTTLTKTPNNAAAAAAAAAAGNDSGAKMSEKFVADYSKAETFDDDLQEALRRSMMDQ